MRKIITGVAAVALLVGLAGSAVAAEDCKKAGRSGRNAMWYSILHPGVGEWYLNGWGNFNENVPQKKFFLGFIPMYGWPGYLQVISAIDASNCRTGDNLTPHKGSQQD